MRHGYDRLAELAELELEIAEQGDFERLPALWEERRRLVSELPAIPPREAQPALEKAASLQGRTTAVLEQKLAVTRAELRHLGRGRTAMTGYAGPAQRTPLVDRAG